MHYTVKLESYEKLVDWAWKHAVQEAMGPIHTLTEAECLNHKDARGCTDPDKPSNVTKCVTVSAKHCLLWFNRDPNWAPLLKYHDPSFMVKVCPRG